MTEDTRRLLGMLVVGGALPAESLGRVEAHLTEHPQESVTEALVNLGLADADTVESLFAGGAPAAGAPTIRQAEAARVLADSLPALAGGAATLALAASATEPEAGASQLGRHAVVGQLGVGGMGAVLEVRDAELLRPMAAKVIRGEATDEGRARFVEEARVTGLLEHPNIPPIHELGATESGELYFTMKKVAGKTLAQLLQRRHSTPLAALLDIFRKVCDGVSFAHAKGVLHRDLKPANVMVGAFGEVLVMDWGLAKILDREELDSTVQRLGREAAHGETLDGDIKGTPMYMSPEQARGEVDALGPATDIYALGAILYHIVAGVPPLERLPMMQLLVAVSEGRVTPPSQRSEVGEVPRELEAVVLKAMAAAPADRYADVEALVADLVAFREHRALEAVRYSPLQRLGKWLRRHRVGVAAAAAVLLAAVVTGVGVWQHQRNQRTVEVARALEQADQAMAGLPAREQLRAALAEVRREGFTTHEAMQRQQASWKPSVARYLEGVLGLERALSLDRERDDLRQRRALAGERLGLAALLAGDHTIARQTFEDLAAWGRSPAEVAALTKAVDDLAIWLARWRRQRLERMLADLSGGLARRGRHFEDWLLEDYVFEACSYRDSQTITLLAAALRDLRQRPAGRGLTQPQRELAGFCCQVLGRLGGPAAVEALAAWAAAASEPEEVIAAGRALCLTQHADAYLPLVELRQRLGARSSGWQQIRRSFNRVPEPSGPVVGAGARYQRGYSRFERADLTGALEDVEALLARNPDHVQALVLRGRILAQRGDLADAALDLERAAEVAPDNAGVRLQRAMNALNMQRVDEAMDDLTRVIEQEPGNALAYRVRSEGHILRKALAAAQADIEMSIKLDARQAISWFVKARIHRELREYSEALAASGAAIAIDPGHRLVLGQRAGLLTTLGRTDEAIEVFDRAIGLAPDDPSLFIRRAGLRRKTGDLEGAFADCAQALSLVKGYPPALAMRARLHIARKQFAQALADADRAIAAAPRNLGALTHRAMALEGLGRFDEAMAACQRALELNARSSLVLQVRARLHERAGRHRQAREDRSAATRFSGNPAQPENQRGLDLRAAGKRDEALQAFARAIAIAPYDKAPWLNRGQTYLDMGDLARAASDFDKALELDPRYVPALLGRGACFNRSGAPERALVLFQRAVELDPNSADAHNRRGAVRYKLDQHAAALEDFKRAIELAPDMLLPQLNRAHARIALGRAPAAAEGLDETIRRWPQHVGALQLRGRAHRLAGNRSAALADFDRSLELAPKDWRAHQLAAVAFGLLKDPTRARAALLRAIELAPAARRASLQKRLQRLPE